MQIQVNQANELKSSVDLSAHVKKIVESKLGRFSSRITRIEVHLGDENSSKGGARDKRCMMEARLEGMQPTAVTDSADTVGQAITGAVDKLGRKLDSVLGRTQDRH